MPVPSGVVERKHLRLEAGLPCFPQDFPDATSAYRAWAEQTAAETDAIEAALPPPQRRSHVAAEVLCSATSAGASPESSISGVPAWSRVIPLEGSPNPRLHVLRGSDAATQVCMLNTLLFGGGPGGTSAAARRARKRRQRRRKARLLQAEADAEGGPAAGTAELLLDVQADNPGAVTRPASDEPLQLLAVQVQPLGRGPEKVFSRGAAELCLPAESDITEWRRHGNGGHAKNASEQWPGVLVDLPPSKILPREEPSGAAGADADSGTGTDHPGDARAVRGAQRSDMPVPARQPIGFLTNGGYSWERGRPNGVGFASLTGLRELFSKDVMVGLCHTPPTAAVRFSSGRTRARNRQGPPITHRLHAEDE